MRVYLMRAPSWLVAVITGGAFVVSFSLITWITYDDADFVVALLGGVVLGAGVALATRKQRREQLRVLEQRPAAEWLVVRRAAWRGPVPEEPQIRAAALDLAKVHYRRVYRFRWWITGILGLNVVFAVVRLIAGVSPWHLVLMAAFWTAAIGSHWYTLRRLRGRVQLLQ